MSEQLNRLSEGIFTSIKGYIERNLRPWVERIQALEDRAPVVGEKGDPGKDAEPVDVEKLAADVLSRVPIPKDGKDGVDGKDAPAVDVEKLAADVLAKVPTPKDGKDAEPVDVAKLAADVLAQIPAPKDGKDGVDGKDAPPVDVEKLTADVLASIPVPKDGIDGKDADPAVIVAEVEKAVAAIPKPKDGESVPIEVVRALIELEASKAVAALPPPKDGADGIDGRDGQPGLDAFAIDVLPEIDAEKRYQRGTWAKHNGGLWMARTATDGLTGWDCIVNGIAGIETTIDGREFALKAKMSDGSIADYVFAVPALLDRGIYKAETDYVQGDVTTWDGSMWIAQKATQDKPGTSDAWRLSVKRGRDGRDGLRGEKGERGAEGRAGKDLTQVNPISGEKW